MMAASGLWKAASTKGMAVAAANRTAAAAVTSSAAVPLTTPPRRTIVGKALRDHEAVAAKPKPWNYEKWEFNLHRYVLFNDRTTLRLDENSKIVVVEGAHGVGKSKFAAELAEELGMKYVPQPKMDDIFLSPYGEVHLADYNDVLPPRCQTYDEKDFARDPLGPVPGCADRLLLALYRLKWRQYWLALRHLFNTGQGVVLEGSPFSDYCGWTAAYNAGWVEKDSRDFVAEHRFFHYQLLRPNLIVYLDAPVDVVQKKIAARGNEWDKDSPVWGNTEYLTELYGLMKRDYLKKAQPHSHVLVYDWSEPGETEIVVEDIEKLNFDYWGQFEEPQKDWRLYNEDLATGQRIKFSRCKEFTRAMRSISEASNVTFPDALWLSAHETRILRHVLDFMPHHRYLWGYNADAGDKNILFKMFGMYQAQMFDYLQPFSFPARYPGWSDIALWGNLSKRERDAAERRAVEDRAAEVDAKKAAA